MWPLSQLTVHRYYDIVRDVRQNKGSILKASVEYIRKLKSDQHKKRLLEEKLKAQDAQNKKLLLKIQVCFQKLTLKPIQVKNCSFFHRNMSNEWRPMESQFKISLGSSPKHPRAPSHHSCLQQSSIHLSRQNTYRRRLLYHQPRPL